MENYNEKQKEFIDNCLKEKGKFYRQMSIKMFLKYEIGVYWYLIYFLTILNILIRVPEIQNNIFIALWLLMMILLFIAHIWEFYSIKRQIKQFEQIN